jgi:hypothetical protein
MLMNRTLQRSASVHVHRAVMIRHLLSMPSMLAALLFDSLLGHVVACSSRLELDHATQPLVISSNNIALHAISSPLPLLCLAQPMHAPTIKVRRSDSGLTGSSASCTARGVRSCGSGWALRA